MLVADEDAKSILTLDLDTHASLAQTPLGATPAQLYVANDGRVFVTLRDKNEVVMLVASTAEATGIFLNGLKNGALPADDAAYLGQQVAARTGLSVPDAQKRVTEAFARVQIQAREADATAREAADKARKASAKGALWLFVSLLIGAFVASLAATFGGRQRDAA